MSCANKDCVYHKTGVLCPACDMCGGYMESNNDIKILKESGKIDTADMFNAIAFCKTSKVGKHMCSVQTRYGWCCDQCLEPELLMLNVGGIHTINSCCGHGDYNLSSIAVVGDESIAKMEKAGYEATDHQISGYAHRTRCFKPKTKFFWMMEEQFHASEAEEALKGGTA